jgi:hypothetical protein
MDVVASHDLGYDPPLRRQAPVPRPKAVQKGFRGHAPMYTR